MLTEKQQKICEKYSKRDTNGLVQCNKCPLRINPDEYYDTMCKANSHYDKHTRKWECDE